MNDCSACICVLKSVWSLGRQSSAATSVPPLDTVAACGYSVAEMKPWILHWQQQSHWTDIKPLKVISTDTKVCRLKLCVNLIKQSHEGLIFCHVLPWRAMLMFGYQFLMTQSGRIYARTKAVQAAKTIAIQDAGTTLMHSKAPKSVMCPLCV